MNKRLYIGNLSSEVTEQDLTHNFSTVGNVVSAVIIKDRYSNQSKGFGFVEMVTDEGAEEAIKRFNGGELDGKTIVVNEARPKKEMGAGGGRPGGSYSNNRGPGGGRPGGPSRSGGPGRGRY